MCGIAGIINFQGSGEDSLRRMLKCLSLRGPDHQGIWYDDRVTLGHARLSIIDISTAGNQPMWANDNVITYNGEIYNFPALKESLHQLGYRFETGSDTEVLLKGYHCWGMQSLLQKLEGMFAFCLYDQKKGLVFFCRDRLGKKPLYLCSENGALYFASEITSLRSVGLGKGIDLESLDYYLTELAVPQPKSIFTNIEQLRPATFRTISINNPLGFIDKQYYQPSIERQGAIEEAELLRQLEEHLGDAIFKRTIADVPIGAFLSGGVDSGLIVALLAERSNSPVKTFSVGFEEESHNELPLARLVSSKYSTEHTEILLNSSDLPEALESTLTYVGEPFADPSILPTAVICKHISRSVKVALSGDGGDEIFGGYGEFLTAYNTDNFALLNNPLARNIKVFQNNVQRVFRTGNSRSSLYNAYLKMDGASRLSRYQGFDKNEKARLYTEAYQKKCCWGEEYMSALWSKNGKENSILDSLFLTMLQTRLLNNYLVKVDRASMMNSLEVRSPFVDHRLIDFAFRINASQLLNGGITTKYLLKKLVQKKYDPLIMQRTKKGFEMPLAKWLRGDLREMTQDLLSRDSVKDRGLFNEKVVEKYLSEHMNKKHDHSYRIWSLLCLEIWFRHQNFHKL